MVIRRGPIALSVALACSLCAASFLLESATGPALPPTTLEELRARLLAEGLPACAAHERLRELCTVAPHRLAGSRGAARAVEWARGAMEQAGLENVRLEPCLVPHWERGGLEELVVVEPEERAGERLPCLALGGSVATPEGGLEAEVIAVRSFEELRSRAAQAAGRIVLFDRPMDPALLDPFEAYGGAVDQRSRGAVEAARAGAVAALVRSMTLLEDDEPHTGSMHYEDSVGTIPAAAVSTNAADLLGAWLRSGQRVRLRLALGCHWLEDAPSYNVVGELVGSEKPAEIVLLGAHLDAWDVGQGAHDDAAGCAHVIEAARMLADVARDTGRRAARTIRFVLFMNEENGLRGAQAYRDQHREELGHHVLAIESDRGGFLPLGWASEAEGETLDALSDLLGDPPLARGAGADISPLGQHGVPLVGLYTNPQRYFDFHHSRRDTLEAVNARELELGAAWMAALASLAAERKEPLPRTAAVEAR